MTDQTRHKNHSARRGALLGAGLPAGAVGGGGGPGDQTPPGTTAAPSHGAAPQFDSTTGPNRPSEAQSLAFDEWCGWGVEVARVTGPGAPALVVLRADLAEEGPRRFPLTALAALTMARLLAQAGNAALAIERGVKPLPGGSLTVIERGRRG